MAKRKIELVSAPRPDERKPKQMATYWEAMYQEVMRELDPLMMGSESAVECIRRIKRVLGK